MRIVAGRWRGRRIAAPPGVAVRPTLGRVREAWMSILQADMPDAAVLDLFAGSGALGLEALSRGAKHATFLETSARVLRVLRHNIEALGAADYCTVKRLDAMRFAESLQEDSFDVAFADPPYGSGAAVRLATLWLDNRFASVLAVEHPRAEQLPGAADTRRYGSTAVTIYR